MWGGITSAKELRAIADVADKFNVPTVKVTGGQRIDLLGVKKEDLPAVWADLNAAYMVSGAAYAKGLRTVKTCVGSEWCRFGTQDSTGLGVKIEKFMWGSWTPAKVKMAVSGCPRNCAEAGIKDMVVYSWQGFAVPKGTPPDVVQQLTKALQAALRDPQTEKTLQGLGFEVVANTPQQFSAFQQAEVKRWKDVIQKANIQLE